MSVLLSCLTIASSECLAEDAKVLVKVRAVRATTKDVSRKSNRVVVDKRIKDLGGKLKSLAFNHYRMVASHEETIQVRRKRTMPICEGHSLTLRPISADPELVVMWLKWLDPSGVELLDTRLHITPGQSMLAGTESAPNTGMIFAIDVSPVR